MGRFLEYRPFDASNGKGFHSSIFFSGCPFKCKGCWNPQSWNPRNGEEFTDEVLTICVEGLRHESVSGLSILGGEPLESLQDVKRLVEAVRAEYSDTKKIWMWTGYTWEDIMSKNDFLDVVSLCDVVIDGQFEIDKRDSTLLHRGSSNQRVIDVKRSLVSGYVVSYL